MRVDRAPDERRDLQVWKILDPVDPDSRAFVEVDVLRSSPADDVEQGDRPAVALVVHSLGEEDRVGDLKPGFLAHLAEHGLLDGLAVLDRPAEQSGFGISGLSSRWCRSRPPSSVTISSIAARRTPHRSRVRI